MIQMTNLQIAGGGKGLVIGNCDSNLTICARKYFVIPILTPPFEA